MLLLTQKKGLKIFLPPFLGGGLKKIPFKVNEAFLLLINNCIFRLNSR
jgi:hypothetical protein